MRIIKISGKKIEILWRINRRTGEVQMIPQEAYDPNHEGIERLLPTTHGKVTENDPETFPKQRTVVEDEGDVQKDVITL